MNKLDFTQDTELIFMEDIDAIDFTKLKLKLQDKEEGQGWSAEMCEDAEVDYKRFLALMRLYPDKDIVPNEAIDKFWHQHILDTQQYAKDTESIFGYFLHHFPYFGMNGHQDAQNLSDSFQENKRIIF